MATNGIITVAILAKDKAHVLPTYLKTIEEQTYPSEKIRLYIRTNNNNDNTEELLTSWIERVKERYLEIHFDNLPLTENVQDYKPHDWNAMRLEVIGKLRKASIDWALERGTDYFTADCDNFINPNTMEKLYATQLSAVGPFLRNGDDPSSLYANFHYDTDENGDYKDSPHYYSIWSQHIKGLFEVNVIHCTYLLRHEILDKINYVDGSQRFEYVIFSETLRKLNIPQYLDNREVYGTLTFCDTAEDFREKFPQFYENKV